MIMRHRINNEEYLGQYVFSRDMQFYDSGGAYTVKAKAHRLYRGLPAKRPSKTPIKIYKKTNAFWVYEVGQGQRQMELN